MHLFHVGSRAGVSQIIADQNPIAIEVVSWSISSQHQYMKGAAMTSTRGAKSFIDRDR